MDTGLYYSLSVQPDGSGQQLLFTDAARLKPAGNFTWAAPQWNGKQPGVYPAIFHITFQITAGDFAGDRGTIDFTADDATGENGTVHVTLTTAQGERSVSDFTVKNGMVVSGADKATLTDGVTYDENDVTEPSGMMVCTIVFDDGSRETLDMGMDGAGSETLIGPDGTQDVSGAYDASGTDTLTFQDGTTDTVNNVDTSSDDSTPSDDSGGKKARPRHP